MQVVRTLFWVLLAILLVVFTMANWQIVPVRIWQNLILETKLPVLVIGAFLLGLVPMWLIYRTSKWRANRRIAALETSLAGIRPATPPVTADPVARATPVNDPADPIG